MKKSVRITIILTILVSLLGNEPAQSVRAANEWVVTNTNDSGAGSLRHAIENSTSGDTITFDLALSGQTIVTSGLVIEHDLTIDGTSLSEHIKISGDNLSTVIRAPKCSIQEGCTIATVIIKGLDVIDGGSGGIRNFFSGTMHIYDVNFHENHDPEYRAGAIMNGGNMTISNSTFTNNSGEYGGAIFNSGTISINNSIIANNTSEGRGGGIYNEGRMAITDTTFANNHANSNGGAIFTRVGTNVAYALIIKSALHQNSTGNQGEGAIYSEGNSCSDCDQYNPLTIINSTIANNLTTGIKMEHGSILNLANNTISGNTKGGVSSYGFEGIDSYIFMENNIIAGNTGEPDCKIGNYTNIPTNTNNLIEVNGIGENACGIPTITDDPQLGPLQDNGGPTQTMALLPSSPAIDAGDDGSCPETDQRGVIRPQGIHCDIGAYEKIIPTVSSIIRNDQNPTAAANVDFTVTFSELVTGVDTDDFELFTSGVTSASITGVSGSEDVYTVTVDTGSGNGSIRLDLIDDDSIEDLFGNKLGGSGAGNGDFTSGEFYTVFKLPPKPVGIPRLSLPRRNSITNDATPSFNWTNVVNAQGYEIVIATDSAFTQVVLSETVSSPTFTPSVPLEDGRHFWRVRALNSAAQPGRFSLAQAFTIDTTAPNVPALTSPMDAASLRLTPVFRWTRTAGAVLYEFQYDNDADFSSPTYSVLLRTNYRKPPAMPNGTHYWRVRARDAAGNWSEWSPAFTVTIN